MKIFKKFIAFCLAFSFAAALLPGTALAAQSSIYLSESFSDSATNSLPKGAKTSGSGSIIRVEEHSGNKFLKIRNIWSDTSATFSFSPGGTKLNLETRFLSEKNNGKTALLQISDMYESTYDLVCLDSNIIKDSLNNYICRYNGGYMTVRVELDLKLMVYDVIIDGALKASRIKINGTIKSPKNVSFVSYATGGSENSIMYDYLFAYDGTETLSFSDTKTYNAKVVNVSTDEVTKPDDAAELMMSENFDSTSVGSTPEQLQAVNGAQGVEEITEKDGTTSKVYAFHANAGVSPYANISFSAPDKKMVMQARVKTGKLAKDGKLFMIKDSAGTFCEFMSFNTSCQLVLYDKSALSTISFKNQWHDVAVAVDFKKQQFDVYIDKKLVKQGLKLMRNIVSDGIIRFQPASSEVSDETILYIDDVMLYTGCELREFSADDADEPANSTKENYPYEVNDSKLSVQIDKLSEQQTGTPDKLSEYLNYDYSSKSVFDDSICLVTGNEYLGINSKRYKADSPVIRYNNVLYAPVRTLGIIGNEEVTFNAADSTVSIGKWSFKAGDESIKNGSEAIELGAPIINRNGTLYLPLIPYAGQVWHKYCGETVNGLIVINSNKDFNASAQSYKRPAKCMINYLIYDRPSATTLLDTLQTRYPDKKHKRTIVTDEQLQKMRYSAENTEVGKKWSQDIISAADSVCNGEITKQDKEGSAISGWISHTNVLNLFWAYQITGDRKYVDRAVAHAENMASFERWKSSSADWLINASILLSAGFMYDLFYDELGDTAREHLADAMIKNGLNDAIDHYYGRGGSDWPIRESNWNIVCNAGVLIAATALMDDRPEVCSEAVEKALISLECEMDTFAPDGGGVEGMAYWHYIVQHMVLIFQTLENAYGNDFGIEKFPGIMETGYFPIYGSGSQDYFSYGDADYAAHIDSPEILWFAGKTGDINLQNARLQQCSTYGYNGSFISLLWYTPSDNTEVQLDKDAYYRVAEVATMRSGWDESSTWVGMHAGYNSSVHGQFDIGDFEYELYGTRMAGSMGRDNYNLPNYFGARNKYYVHRTEGQNCYVINPDSSAGQDEYATADIKHLFSNDSSSAYMIDMSSAYAQNAKEAKRAYMLSNARSVFTIQDEIVPKAQNDDVYWFWHTDADVTLDEANSTVVLKKGWVKTTLHIDSNVPFTMSYEKAEPMSSSPQQDGQLSGKNMHKIVFNFTTEAEKVIFRVTAVPMYMDYTPGELTEISQWTPEENKSVKQLTISKLLINGSEYQGFIEQKTQYELPYDYSQGTPQISAEANGNVKVFNDGNNRYVIECTEDGNPGNAKYIGITLKSKTETGMPQGNKITPVSYEGYGSVSIDDGAPASQAFDGNLNTRWAVEGDGSYLVMDFGEEKTMTAFYYALYLGNQRQQYFTLEASNDGVNFEPVADVTSSGTTAEYEYVNLDSVKARYLRVMCYGNSQHKWNSFAEVGVCAE